MMPLRHNMVSILYTIKGMIETHLALVEEAQLAQSEKRLAHAEEVLRRAYAQTRKALRITRLLAVSIRRCQPKRIAGHHASVQQCWSAVLEKLRADCPIPMKNLEVIESIPPDFPEVACRSKDLHEMIYFVAQNALQAMRPDERRKRRLIIRVQYKSRARQEPVAAITIADTGPGMPVEQLGHIFQPFYTTKSHEEGSGLGLYMTHKLALQNGGRISVAGFENAGTSFILEFPLAAASRPS